MSEPVLEPAYWKARLEAATARGELHRAVFQCPLNHWERIEAKHRGILGRLIKVNDAVLDCGCGYGRLLSLLPGWPVYRGVDLSPDLVDLAKARYPTRVNEFYVADLRDLSRWDDETFTWAVMISVRPMVRRNCGDAVWDEMEREIRRVAKRLLYLEYDENDEGSVE